MELHYFLDIAIDTITQLRKIFHFTVTGELL
jgi:hypothetical protein